MTDYELMGAALAEAEQAAALGEVPVGAVIAKDGEIIASAHNTRETEKNALHHAELLAIDAACKKLGGWRLWQCELFVTLEPCPMCSGAILNSRIRRVVYGAADTKAGCCGSDNIAQFLEKRKWVGARPVRPAVQSPPGGGKRAAGRGSTGAVAGVFPPAAGGAGRQTPLETARDEVKIEKSGNCVKKSAVPTFFFREIVLYYSMETCRNHTQSFPGTPQDRT